MISIHSLKTLHFVKKVFFTLICTFCYLQTSYSDSIVTYSTKDGPQVISIKNNQALIKNKDQNELLFDAKDNTITLIQHDKKTYSIVNEDTLKRLAQQINGIQSAIASQLSNLPPEQRAQLEAFLGGGLSNQAKQNTTYSIQDQGKSSYNSIECQKKSILENGAITGSICLSNEKQIGINSLDYATLTSLQEFMINASDIMQDSIGKLTKVKLPNFKSINIDEIIIAGVINDNPNDKISLSSATSQTITGNFVIPQGYAKKDIISLASLAQ
jgi:hypothetical protein